MTEEKEPWAWVVVVMSLLALLLNTSMSFIAGVMHVALLENYQGDVTATSWLGSLYSCMFALSGPVASFIINRWNCRTCVSISGVLGLVGFATSSVVTDIRWLFVTYALVAGLGQGLCYTGCLVILGFYFKERTSLATGVGIAGCGLGNLVLPPLAQKLVEVYGLNGAFRILGGLSFEASVCGFLLRPSKLERRRHIERSKSDNSNWTCAIPKSYSSLISAKFVCYLSSVFAFAVGCSTLKLYLPDFIMRQGASYQYASLQVSLIGFGSMLSRVFLGFASADDKIGPFLLFSGSNVIVSILIFFIKTLTSTPILQAMFSLCYGIYNGGNWALFNPMTYDIVGIENLASGVGLAMFMCGAGYLVGGPIAGVLYEASGVYDTAFIFSAASFLLVSILGLLVTVLRSQLHDTDEPTRKDHFEGTICVEPPEQDTLLS